MRSRFQVLIAVAVLGGLAAACAPESSESTPMSEPATAAPPTAAVQASILPVQVDGKTPDYNASFLAYFPQQVTAHPGDTVDFSLVNTGEPHTVTLGTLANDAAEQFEALGPQEGENTPAAQALPMSSSNPYSVDLYQSTAQPCFMDSGPVPTSTTTACPATEQPAFNGQQAMYSSGWLAPEAKFAVKLADDIKPGTYRYLCLIHRGTMMGTLTVVGADETVPTADEVKTQGDAELNALAAKLKPAVDQAVGGATSAAPVAGVGDPTIADALANLFAPKVITITAGSAVTWPMIGPHTVSFNAPEDANQLRVENSDGTVVVNPLVVAPAPAGSPGMTPPPPPPAPPTAAPGTTPPPSPTADPNAPMPPPTLIDAGEWDGTGELSSGLVLSFPPAMYAYQVTFTKPGTYTYKCLVHPDMEGTVQVQ